MHTLSSVSVAQTLTSETTLLSCVDSLGAVGLGTSMLYARNAEIYGDEEEAEYLYRVV